MDAETLSAGVGSVMIYHTGASTTKRGELSNMKIKDRIKELRRVKASTLRANPDNWRTHPVHQQAVLQGVLEDIGWAGAIIARDCGNGELEVIDGHLRMDVAQDEEVPVLILDVNEAEARTLLATLDPIAAMAEEDTKQLRVVLEKATASNADLQGMLWAMQEETTRILDSVQFSPEVEPATSEDVVDETDIEEAEQKLAEQFEGEPDLRKVICPYCAKSFEVDR